MFPARFRYLASFILVTVGLATLSAVTAISLFHEQAAVARLLSVNVQGRRTALDLRECLRDLIALEQTQIEELAVLHERVRDLLAALEPTADSDEERILHAQMTEGFALYLRFWQALPPRGTQAHDEARHRATLALEHNVMQPCVAFASASSRHIDQTALDHELTLRRHAWGLAIVGGLGSIAGAVLGFGIARNLSRTLRELRIQVRDASGLLLPDKPEIILRGESSLPALREDMNRLSDQIAQTMHALQQRELEVLRARQLAAVGQLAAGVGHEIRNPLTSIKMLVQYAIEEGGLTEEDLRIIEAEIRRMEQSLKTFLDFAKPPKAERRRTTIDAVLAGVVDLLRARASRQKVSVEYQRADAALDADPIQLQQVFVNLGLNALDAMPHGGTLAIAVEPEPGAVRIVVRDTGPGIDAAILPRLFEPFVSGKETGLGLGLVISKRIVEDHGGRIEVANAAPAGASLTVRLPRGED